MPALPADSTLTEEGLAPDRGGAKILILACGALAREILAVKAANRLDHIDLACLPAKYHNRPEQIPEAVAAAVAKHRANYDAIHVAYADCGTGGRLAAVCEELGVEMMAGPHCYAFFEGQDAFAAHAEDEVTAFYLTDFLTRQFDTLVWKGLKLDRHPELRDMIFGNYTKVVYQAQTLDPALEAKARAAAEKLGLDFEMRLTGYGELAEFVRAAAEVAPR